MSCSYTFYLKDLHPGGNSFLLHFVLFFKSPSLCAHTALTGLIDVFDCCLAVCLMCALTALTTVKFCLQINMKNINVQQMMADLELRELQARALYFYNRENLRSQLCDQMNDRTQQRLHSLTTHADYRNCVSHSPAKRSANTPTKKSESTAKKTVNVVDLSMLSDDEEFEAIAQGIKKRQRVNAVVAEAKKKIHQHQHQQLPLSLTQFHTIISIILRLHVTYNQQCPGPLRPTLHTRPLRKFQTLRRCRLWHCLTYLTNWCQRKQTWSWIHENVGTLGVHTALDVLWVSDMLWQNVWCS